MSNLIPVLAQSSNTDTTTAMIVLVIQLAIAILIIAGFWKVFTKAGQPGWAAIVPIYNMYILCKVAGRPGWWLLLLFIPFVNFIVLAVLSVDVAKSFGKGIGFGIGLWLLGMIFYPILGFGSAEYHGPAAA
jgi:hypothetical protein